MIFIVNMWVGTWEGQLSTGGGVLGVVVGGMNTSSL